jgi:hypothetical protein
MPRQISPEMTFDDMESEVLFTTAALKAEPEAVDFIGITESWLPLIDDVRKLARQVRAELSEIDARRIVANKCLDSACVDFADDLFRDVQKDRKSARFRQFFPVAASSFVRQGLARQVATVRGWVDGAKDPVLDKHRDELRRWAEAADKALIDTRGSAATRRGELWQRREELADTLTRERDSLRDALAEVAREKRLPRDWADMFFRVSTRRRSTQDVEPEESSELSE